MSKRKASILDEIATIEEKMNRQTPAAAAAFGAPAAAAAGAGQGVIQVYGETGKEPALKKLKVWTLQDQNPFLSLDPEFEEWFHQQEEMHIITPFPNNLILKPFQQITQRMVQQVGQERSQRVAAVQNGQLANQIPVRQLAALIGQYSVNAIENDLPLLNRLAMFYLYTTNRHPLRREEGMLQELSYAILDLLNRDVSAQISDTSRFEHLSKTSFEKFVLQPRLLTYIRNRFNLPKDWGN